MKNILLFPLGKFEIQNRKRDEISFALFYWELKMFILGFLKKNIFEPIKMNCRIANMLSA